MLVVQRAAMIVAAVIAIVALAVLLDYAVRLPAALRLMLLLAGVTVAATTVWRRILTAARFDPGLTQLALRVERMLPAVEGRLASGVEFATAGLDSRNPMAARSVRDVQERLAGQDLSRVLRPARTRRDVSVFLAVLAVGAGLVIWRPAEAGIGLARLLAPYSGAKWPARTGVESEMYQVLARPGVHPRGQALTLRARVTQGAPDQQVVANVRFERDGRSEPVQRMVMTWQGDKAMGGAVHERLVDASADAVEVWFTTADAQTEVERVLLVPPPAVIRADLSVQPPAYARGIVPPLEASLGPGTDKRSEVSTPLLAGSRATLQLELNGALPVPEAGEVLNDWIRSTFSWPGEAESPTFAADSTGNLWVLSWTLAKTVDLRLRLVDEHGLENVDDISYRIEVIEDRPPAVVITEPSADRSVLAGAVVPVDVQSADDVLTTRIGLEAKVVPPVATATPVEEGAAEGAVEPKTTPWTVWEDRAEAQTVFGTPVELAPFNLKPGDVIALTGLAQDGYVLDGRTHEAARSPVRRLRVVSDVDFATNLRRQLAGVRQNAIRIEATQGEVQDDIVNSSIQPGIDRAQAQVGERVAAQRQALEEIEQAMRDNRLDDDQLGDLLSQSRDLVEAAGRASTKAVEHIQQRSGAAGNGENTPETNEGESGPEQAANENADTAAADQARPEDREIVQAQQDVREELSDLIELLDRDEDTWVITHQLEDVLQQQDRLQAQTEQVGRQTVGQNPEDLSQESRTALDKIARTQNELRDQARALTENLRNRAQNMEAVDPQSARAMNTAAQTADARQLERDMQEAAQQAQQNQVQSATESQQRASETMKEMLRDIQDTRRARTEELLRKLGSLVESIERLITVQENELVALGKARADNALGGLDRGMIRLSENTRSVAEEARDSGAAARRIARSLDRAADSQGAAIIAMRAAVVNAGDVQAAEDRSLQLLQEALDQAKALQEQTQKEQTREQREALLDQYRKFAERQVALREQTEALGPGPELDRRQLVEARRLGTDQEEIRKGLVDLEATTAEIAQSMMFSHAHRLIDGWAAIVRDDLQGGTVGPAVTAREQTIADAMGRLIAALEETLLPPDQFADGQSQSGQGDGQGQGEQGEQPLIPPVAEIKLLHGLQEQIYLQTRSIDATTDLPADVRGDQLRDLGRRQRELHDIGEQILEMLQNQGGGGASAAPSEEGGGEAGEGEPDTGGKGEGTQEPSQPEESS